MKKNVAPHGILSLDRVIISVVHLEKVKNDNVSTLRYQKESDLAMTVLLMSVAVACVMCVRRLDVN